MAVKEFQDRPEGFNRYTNHHGRDVVIDPTLAHNVLCLVEAAKATNGDVLLIFDGEEGSGKSTIARQIGRLVDATLTEKRIEFNPQDAINSHFRGLPEVWDPGAYMRGEYTNKPWEVMILDESAKLDRKRTMSAGSVEFTGFLSQSRQLHKIFIVVLPNVHMLDSYVAEHRALALIHCYKHEKQNMGFYKYFTRQHLRFMFSSEMHKRKQYHRNPAFMGRFSGTDPFDLTKYEQKKAGALNAYRRMEGLDQSAGITPEEAVKRYQSTIIKNTVEKGLVVKHICEAMGISRQTFYEKKKALEEDKYITQPDTRAEPPKLLLTTSPDGGISVTEDFTQ